MRRELEAPAADRPNSVRVVSWLLCAGALLLSLAHGAQFSGGLISLWAGGGLSPLWPVWHGVGLVACSVSLYGALYLPRRETRGYNACLIGGVWLVSQVILKSWFFPVLGVVTLLMLRKKDTKEFMKQVGETKPDSVTPLV